MKQVLAIIGALALSGCMETAPLEATPETVDVTRAINGFRHDAGLADLERSGTLDRVAQNHALDMVRRDYYDHVSPEGLRVSDRARRAGYAFCWVGENIASGHPTDAGVLDAWMRSSGHRRNILRSEAKDFGYSRVGNKYVMVVGRDGC